MNAILLQEKLQAVSNLYPEVPVDVVDRIGQVLTELSEWQLFRINPMTFASQYNLDLRTVTDLFIYGAKVGLFHFDWNMICPYCGSIEHTYASLSQIDIDMENLYCSLCDEVVSNEADKMVEVSFTLAPEISGHQIDPFADSESYNNFFFSRSFQRSAAFQEFLDKQMLRGFARIAPSSASVLHLKNPTPGERYRLVSIDKRAVANLYVTDAHVENSQQVRLSLADQAFTPNEVIVGTGPVEIELINTTDSTTGIILMLTDYESVHQLLEVSPPTIKPFLSSKMLLTNQRFREAFLVENLPDDLRLKISELTVLFTDLQGSTELYDKSGDVIAYKLVQEHFKLLTEVVSKHAGATVKTMGDALMASFSSAEDGLAAAIDMLDCMRSFNERMGEDLLNLKVGLHSGPALAVKANETLDFFGQTINIAARVQAQAQAGEVWATDAVYQVDGVERILRQRGYNADRFSVHLKGVNRESVVYQCYKS